MNCSPGEDDRKGDMKMVDWNPDNLNALIRKAGMTKDAVAAATGLSVASINGYTRGGKSAPGLEALIKMADFFAVPLDFIVGRCTEEEYRGIVDRYDEHFMELRRAPY